MPLINTAYVFNCSLTSQADTRLFQNNPSLAAGDVKVSINEGAFANITTLPTVTPAGGRNVKVSLSAAEMNGSRIKVQFVDVAGAEWCDYSREIETSPDDVTVANIKAAILADATSFNGASIAAILAKTNLLPATPAATGDAMTLTSGERTAIATAMFKLDLSTITGEAARSLINALRMNLNKFTIAAGVLTVYKEDDTTVARTSALTSAAGNPITSVDPT